MEPGAAQLFDEGGQVRRGVFNDQRCPTRDDLFGGALEDSEAVGSSREDATVRGGEKYAVRLLSKRAR